jgi:uncharacterized delta-60 repeat protein
MVTEAPPNSFDSLSAIRLAIGNDDSIVVVLSLAGAGGREAEIQRLTSTGTVDGSFGESGIVMLDFSFEHPPITDLPGIALRPNVRIVLGGSSTGQNIDRAPDPVVTRLKTDGSTDPHFGKNGVFWPLGIGGEGSISDLALLSNGKILITGGLLRKGEAFVARLTKNGKLDNKFGKQGFVKLQAGKGSSPDSESDAIALAPDGRILIAGTASTKSGGRQAFAARLTSDGHRDKKFGSDGIERIGDPLADAQAPLVDLALSGRKRALLVDDFPIGFRPTATVWVAAIRLV